MREKIAIVGLGVGGIDAAIAAAVDPRIAACAALGAITVRDWADHVAPERNNYDRIFPYLPNIAATTDLQYIYAAIAPRPLLLMDRGEDRADWPADGFGRVRKTSAEIYTLLGAPRKSLHRRENERFGTSCAAALARRRDAAAANRQRNAKSIFAPEEVGGHKPKGPTQCFRQICLEYNSPPRFDIEAKIYGKPASVMDYFSAADPAAYAEFCEKIHLDAALLLGVPEGGFTAYRQTKVGTPYPGMKGDWFGETVRELHRRNIAAFGYIIIGWNDLDGDQHPERWFKGRIPCLNGPYGDLLLAYTREMLENYPLDGLRYDTLDHATLCRCPACKEFLPRIYGEEMPEKFLDWRREQRFRIASIGRFVRRCYEVKQAVRPGVEMWQNWFSLAFPGDLRESRYVDIAYEEFATPADTLVLQGIFGSRAMISGKLLQNPDRRLCLALGGRAYDYFPVE